MQKAIKKCLQRERKIGYFTCMVTTITKWLVSLLEFRLGGREYYDRMMRNVGMDGRIIYDSFVY